jgi:hypothetical protein
MYEQHFGILLLEVERLRIDLRAAREASDVERLQHLVNIGRALTGGGTLTATAAELARATHVDFVRLERDAVGRHTRLGRECRDS